MQRHGGLRRVDVGPRHHDHQPLDQIAQFADVPGPLVLLEHRHRLRHHLFHPQPLLLRMQLHEMPDEQRDIVQSLAKRRHDDRHDVQAVVEVFAKVPLLDLRHKILVGGGQDTHVDLHQLGPADPRELLLLEHAKHLGLGIKAHVADLVQKKRSSIGLLELPALHGGGPSERPLFVPEQLALDQRLGNRGAVDGDEGPLGPRAAQMHGSCNQFLTRPVLPSDEYPAVRRPGRLDQLPQLLHGRRLSDQLELPLHGGPQRLVLLLQSMLLERMFHPQRDVFQRQRLFDVVIGAELDGLDGGFDRAVARHHHHLRVRHQFLEALERLQPVHFGHPNVEHHEIRRIRCIDPQGFRPALRHRNVVPFVLQNAAQRREDRLFIVHDQYRSRHPCLPVKRHSSTGPHRIEIAQRSV